MKHTIHVNHILLVEDDPGSAKLTQLGISRSRRPAEVTWVESGDKALELLQGGQLWGGNRLPDLVLLDISLPGVDGWQVLRRLRTIDKLARLPVIVLTCAHDERYIQKCYELQADGFIHKPLTEDKYNTLLDSDDAFCISLERTPQSDMPSDIFY